MATPQLQGRTGDLITDTAKKLGIAQRTVFDKAAEGKRFSNAADVAEYRYLRWFKHGEVPLFVQDFCIQQWRGIAS